MPSKTDQKHDTKNDEDLIFHGLAKFNTISNVVKIFTVVEAKAAAIEGVSSAFTDENTPKTNVIPHTAVWKIPLNKGFVAITSLPSNCIAVGKGKTGREITSEFLIHLEIN